MSWGPDFVGPDGQFWSMSTKTLTPLCSFETIGSSCCVDVDEDAVNSAQALQGGPRNLYTSIIKRLKSEESKTWASRNGDGGSKRLQFRLLPGSLSPWPVE
ncbi:hypothetical protein BKA58DRAFT_226621 [Alternaria rosae]|uniref:uncharacterized protein n=1 Tax=Alternaria rosae TaxID=1187941 RepID=UPI001E8DDF0C|nr:uncharacterized protein BKA58DRAFT_226621 [Alternaria rosae]KAH6865748.1 hypothetical protein BKA58DRAFT_226621 [Alternaria rosae]